MNTEILKVDSLWQLEQDLDCYSSDEGDELSTQAKAGRCFKVVDPIFPENSSAKKPLPMLKVSFLEDGYQCWLDLKDVLKYSFPCNQWEPKFLSLNQIQDRLPKVLSWIERASKIDNKYLWGGTLGPNFDCSGLVQASFSSQEIWLPRDAYQQKNFCKELELSLEDFLELSPGDLLFFGTRKKYNHVGIYKGNGSYWHSSGLENGRNGIALDSLLPESLDETSSFYKMHLRSFGRVIRCHDGTTLF